MTIAEKNTLATQPPEHAETSNDLAKIEADFAKLKKEINGLSASDKAKRFEEIRNAINEAKNNEENMKNETIKNWLGVLESKITELEAEASNQSETPSEWDVNTDSGEWSNDSDDEQPANWWEEESHDEWWEEGWNQQEWKVKTWFKNVWAWFKKQREWVKDKEEWKNHKWKNVLRVAWWLWILWWIAWLGHKIFGRKNYEDVIQWYDKMSKEQQKIAVKEWKKKSRKERRAQRRIARQKRRKMERDAWLGFRDRWIWKAIKRVWIWTWIYALVHRIVTWKWFKDFFDWTPNSPLNTWEQILDAYKNLKEKDPETYEKYEKVGNDINEMYDDIWQTEKEVFWDDSQIYLWAVWKEVEDKKLARNEEFEHIEAKWLMVFSVDNYFNNIWEMLSCGWVECYMRNKTLEGYKARIISFGAEWFEKVMVPYLSQFAGFATLWLVNSQTAQEKMDKYFEKIQENQSEHLQELDLFFRQYLKILTYFADRKNAIALREAEKIIKDSWYNGKSWPTDTKKQKELLYQVIDDRERVEKNLMSTPYGAFIKSTIRWLSSGYIQDLADDAMTDELRDIIDDVDDQMNGIVYYRDDDGWSNEMVFDTCTKKLENSESLDDNDKKWLKCVVDNMVKDMGNETEGGWLYDTFDYVFEMLWLDEATRQDVLKHAWFNELFNTAIAKVRAQQEEICNNPTKEGIEKLKNLVWEYSSLKKEFAVAMYAILEAKENKSIGDIVLQILNWLWTWIKHFFSSLRKVLTLEWSMGDRINTFLWFTIIGWYLCLRFRNGRFTKIANLGRCMFRVWVAPVSLGMMILWHTRWPWAVTKRILRKTDTTKAASLMERKILEWVLDWEHVHQILVGRGDLCQRYQFSNIRGESADKAYDKILKELLNEEWLSTSNLTKRIKLFKEYRGKVKFSKWWNTNRWTVRTELFEPLEKFDNAIHSNGISPAAKDFWNKMLKKTWSNAENIKFLAKDAIYTEGLNSVIKNLATNNPAWLSELRKLSVNELKYLHEKGILKVFGRRGAINPEELVKMARLAGDEKEICEALYKSIQRYSHKMDAMCIKSINKFMFGIEKESLSGIKNLITGTNGLDAKDIAVISKLCNSTAKHEGVKIWTKMRQLLEGWNMDDIARYLRKIENVSEVKNIVRDVGHNIWSVKQMFKQWGKIFDAASAGIDALRIISKIV